MARRLRNPTIPSAVLSQLRKLEQDCIAMLAACLELGTLILVTNAAPGWIERSGALCLPKLLAWVKQHGVEVVYARQTVEPHQAGDPTHWKPAAFGIALETQRTALSTALQQHTGAHDDEEEEDRPRINLLSIGDGVYERVAARVAASPQDLVKTLKFVDSPSIAQLRQQLKLATQMLPEVVASDHSRSLTLRSILPEKQQTSPTAATPKTASPAATPLDSPGGGSSSSRAAAAEAPTPQTGGGGGGGLSGGLRRAKLAATRAGSGRSGRQQQQAGARRRIDL
jgi:hypothetical protein